MAKQRFRDVKQGRIRTPENGKKRKRTSPPQSRPATLGERFKAFLTDSFMLLMPLMYFVIYLVFGSLQEFAKHRLEGWLMILVPYILISALLISRSGRTPGMRAYEIRVVVCGSGKNPSFGVALLRQILAVWDFFLFTWIAQFFLRDHRTLHEILSGTCLIHDPVPPRTAR